MTVSGGGGAGFDPKLWTIFDVDRQEPIVGQFVAQSVTKNVGAIIARSSSYNAQYPILQWIAGELETISFTAKLWARDSTDFTVDERLERLEALVKRQADLKRPPVCSFSIGDVPSLASDCLVRSLGGITYDELRDDGTTRGVTLQITLERYEEFDVEATDPSTPESFTRIRRARAGDSYESIALDEYADPELGVLLRQLNPRISGMDHSDLRAKDPVHVFPESFLRTLEVAPEFYAFKTGDERYAKAEEARREMFEARSDDAFLTIYATTAPTEF